MRRVASCASEISAVVVTRARHPLQAGLQGRRPAARRRRGPARTARRRRPPAPARSPSPGRPRGRSASRSATPRARTARPRSAPTTDRSSAAARRGRRTGDAEIPSPASRCSDAKTSSLACCSAPTERTAAEAGLLISCASPAASVPRATRASRWRALCSMRRAVPISPRSRWTAKGNHSSPKRASSDAREPEDAARLHDPRRPHVDAVLVPRPEAAGPLAGVLHRRHDRFLVADPPDEVDPPGQQHPPVVGRAALVEQPHAGVVRHLLARRREVGHLLVGEAVEDRDRAQLVDERSCRRQVAVDEVDRHRALADGGGDPLHRVAAYVARGEDAGHAGLQGERVRARAATRGRRAGRGR